MVAPSTRYSSMFANLDAKQQGAFVPFVTLGDPNPEQSLAVVDALIEGGADALELGMPFSDPLADGPTIQDATIRARKAGTTPDTCFDMLATIRAKHPTIPIGLLMYANLVYARGIETFYTRCAEVGVDSVLIADAPISESAPFRDHALAHGIDPIFIAPPNADDKTLAKVAELGRGYTYLVSRAGVTGAEAKAGTPVEHLLGTLLHHQAPRPLLGFGISTPEQVKAAIVAGAAGAISGSAVVKIIETHQHDVPTMLNALTEFVRAMKAATAHAS
ncbi:tryptophan synthase subunit alpha [Salinivibrio sp. IB643]|uniref:tryptophan synthase subunit alpha n=1 Tax=Salinivibrio TaxID=51366 RepID=UPI000989764D|nr:tryptophan synthase subunit alpha [Salinivibrio sp. IB643]OOE97212.1 tryptophan synthase subunit alpha [Salinivibrio sp. IB643]